MVKLASETDLPDGYGWRKFRHEEKFLEELSKYKHYVKTFNKQERQRRALELVRIVYPTVDGPGGEKVAVCEHTKKRRITGTFRELRRYALGRVEKYKGTIDYWIDIERDRIENDEFVSREEMKELDERIAIKLDSCTPEQLRAIGEKYGLQTLGEYTEYMAQ